MIETIRRSLGAGGLPEDRRRAGQALVEYALILILVALFAIVAVGGYGGAVDQIYRYIIANWPGS